jgi:Fe-S-cluster containining protein
VKRISKKLKMSIGDFEHQYLKTDNDGDKVLLKAPCDFLQEDNSCFIYDVRPQACRDYPHTDRKRVVQILDITRKNIEVCPAVEDIVSKIING